MSANLTDDQWQLIIDQVNNQLDLDLKLSEQIVYEIVVYALLINEENREYAFLEITVYTWEPIGVSQVFQCLETQGFKLQRRVQGINRIDVNQLKIGRMSRTLPPGREVITDWCDAILTEMSLLHFEPPKSGYYYRKRSGISESEYKRQQRERREQRKQTQQEILDRYGME